MAVTLLYSWGNHSTQWLRNWSKNTQLVREAAQRRTRHLGPVYSLSRSGNTCDVQGRRDWRTQRRVWFHPQQYVYTCVGQTAGSSGSREYGRFYDFPCISTVYIVNTEHIRLQEKIQKCQVSCPWSLLSLSQCPPSACPHPGPGALETVLTAWDLFGTTPYLPWGLSWGQGNLLKPKSLHCFAWNTFYSGINSFELPKCSFWDGAVEVGDGPFIWEPTSLTWKLCLPQHWDMFMLGR